MPTNDKSKQTAFPRDQAIFLAIAEAASPAERKAILDRECGNDADLRQRVVALLAAHGAEEARPPAHAAVDETLALEAKPGTMIVGRYKLLEEIGEGGMGVVWMAEQREPVRRLVALKLIKAGMDSRSVITRFEAERQAPAMMDHPNIARVFDGGMTEHGRPFFVMELVRGLPVTEYCDQRRMTVHDRLLLFTQICHAVQHAHQKGIIHRDIKPGNVLVTEHDGEPVPKVIDFGLAKALGGGGVLTEHTLYTAFGQMAGTPLYTAPEQIAINALDIDTRADIYALGVLLYELLTGSPPIDRERLKVAAWDEICRVIREEEPPRPSTRLATSAMLPTLAASRQTEPAKLCGLIRGDLDWIILKALEKERRLRYDTTTALVADIERHLHDEPVVAAPPSVGYRAKKFVRKHKTAAIITATAAALIVLGLATTTWQWCRADANATVARQNEEAAEAQRKIAEGRRVEADKQRDSAELEAYIANLAVAQTTIASENYPEARCRLDACPESKRGWEWKFLRKQAAAILYSLPPGTSLHGFSKDGQRMLTRYRNRAQSRATASGSVFLYSPGRSGDGFQTRDAATGLPIGSPLLSDNWSDDKAVGELSPDGMRVVTLSCGTLQLWDATSGRPMGRSLEVRSAFVRFSPSGTRVATVDENAGHHVARIWNLPEGKQVGKSMEHPAKILTLAFSPDGTRLLASCDDHTVRLWNAGSGSPIGEPMRQDHPIAGIEFSPDGSEVLIRSSDNATTNCQDKGVTVGVWDGFSGRPVSAKLEVGPFYYHIAHYIKDMRGTMLGTMLGTLTSSVATFSADGKRVLTDGYDGRGKNQVRLWDVATGAPVGDPIDIEQYFQGISVIHGKDALFTFLCDPDNRPESRNGVSLWTLNGTRTNRSDACYAAAESPDGNLIVLHRPNEADRDHDLISITNIDRLDATIENIISDDPDLELEAAMEDGNGISPVRPSSAKPARTARLTLDGFVQIAEAPGGEVRRVDIRDRKIGAFAISPDGSRLVTDDGSALRFYDTATCRELTAFTTMAAAKELTFTPDGTRLIVQFGDGAQIWDTRPLAERRKMWARRAAERTPAREYVKRLLSQTPETKDWLQAIRHDATIAPLRKLVTLEIANAEIARIDDTAEPLFDSLIDDLLSKSRVVAAVMKEPNALVRTRMLHLVDETDWDSSTASAMWAIISRDDLPKERYQAVAKVADELLAMNPKSTASSNSKPRIDHEHFYQGASNLPCNLPSAIGAAYYRVGRYEEAIRLNRRGIAINIERRAQGYIPNDVFQWCWIAMAQFKLGRVNEARESLKSATAAAPDTKDEPLSNLLATATKLINPPTSSPKSVPRKDGKTARSGRG